MIKKRYLIVLWFLFAFSIPILNAQETSCATKLLEAQQKYNSGQIEEVPGLLHSCLNAGFTREEKIQAYKLLINSYLFDNNDDRAEYYMLEFLRKYPEYEVVDTDPFEFTNLLTEFDNNPRGSFGINVGGNLSFIRVVEPFSVSKADPKTTEYLSQVPGFHAGFFYNLNLTPRLELGFEPMVVQNTFSYKAKPFSFVEVQNVEVQGRIDLPVTVMYLFGNQKLNYYVRAGAKASYLMYGQNDIIRYYRNTGTSIYDEVQGPAIDFDEERKDINFWGVLGGGIRYKIPRAYVFMDVRYNLGIVNQVNESSRNLGTDDRIWLYYLNQDSFVLDELSLTIGIAKTIYNPKRK